MWRGDKLRRLVVSHQERFVFSLRHFKKSLNKTLLRLDSVLLCFVHPPNKGLTFFFQRCLSGAVQVSKSQKGLYDTCNPVIRPSLSKRRDFAQI